MVSSPSRDGVQQGCNLGSPPSPGLYLDRLLARALQRQWKFWTLLGKVVTLNQAQCILKTPNMSEIKFEFELPALISELNKNCSSEVLPRC